MTSETIDVTERLRILIAKLEAEGAYTRANTCAIAVEEIQRLRKLNSVRESKV